MPIGIEAINAYVGQASMDIRTLFQGRNLDLSRFDNLMMHQKTVGLPCEDPVTNGVNAAKKIVDQLSESEKNQIELLITATESGLDFGKSLSNYIHKYLNLPRRCRMFEVKQACYAGTAALNMAAAIIALRPAKALIVATDVARAAVKMTYAEPSQGVTAVAMLVSAQPSILELDMGANGFYGYEVMDTFRPDPEIETGDPDLSLLSYLDCLEGSYRAYMDRVEGADYASTFDYLVFHTPFAGMVKGAHRKMMHEFVHASNETIEGDFQRRVLPSLQYPMKTGNSYSASLYLALCSLIDNIQLTAAKRVGLFSYGSGCASEFFSGVIMPESQNKLKEMRIAEALAQRYALSMEEYSSLLDICVSGYFGYKNHIVDYANFQHIYDEKLQGKGLLILKAVKDYHREYGWS